MFKLRIRMTDGVKEIIFLLLMFIVVAIIYCLLPGPEKSTYNPQSQIQISTQS